MNGPPTRPDRPPPARRHLRRGMAGWVLAGIVLGGVTGTTLRGASPAGPTGTDLLPSPPPPVEQRVRDVLERHAPGGRPFTDPRQRFSLAMPVGWTVVPAEHVGEGVWCVYPDLPHGEITVSSASGPTIAGLPDALPASILDAVFPDMTACDEPIHLDSPYWQAVMRVYESRRADGPQRHLGLVARRGDVAVLLTANDSHVALPRQVEHFAHVMAGLRIRPELR